LLHKLLIVFGVLMGVAWGQGACTSGQALTSRQGFSNLAAVVPGATVTASPGPLYTDQTLSFVLSTSPTTTADAFGNYQLCAAASTQTITVNGPNMQTLVYKLTFSPLGNVVLSGNNVFTGNNTFNGTNTFTNPSTFTGQINCKSVSPAIKCVDTVNTQAWAGTDMGAWINSADAAIGAGTMGEIWLMGTTNATATTQISVGDAHVLKLFTPITITNPILIGKYSRLTCSAANTGAANIVAANGMANMVRMRVQDGSLETAYIDSCIFNGGNFAFTRGIVDLTGFNDIGWVRNLIIYQYASGAGIYMDDCPNGSCVANAGSGHTDIGPIWVNPAAGVGSTGTCLTFTHSNTAGNTPLGPWHFGYFECQLQNATGSVGMLLQNNCTATCGVNQWQFQAGIYFDELEIDNACAACDGLKIDGADAVDITRLYSFGGNATSNLVHVTNNANNLAIHIAKFFNLSAGKAYLDDITTNSSTAKSIKNFVAGSQTTGASAWNSYDEQYTWGNLINVATMPAGLGGANRTACYGSTSINGFKCTLNGNADVWGVSQNAPFYIGTPPSGVFGLDTGGAAGFEYRLLNTSLNFTGLTARQLVSSGTAPTLSGTGACATITTQVGGGSLAGSGKCTAATAASTLTITFPTAPNGWSCTVQDETTRANSLQQTAHTVTTAVFTATSVTQNDVFVFSGCIAF
jgi:hypothetical protein